MKKLTRILSLVLVFAMLSLALSSCGATAEQRVAEAMTKMATAKKSDCTVNVKMKMASSGQTQEVPMTMVIKSDISDEKSPVLYMDMSMTVGNISTAMKTFYKDGFLYTEAQGQKYKVQKSYEEMLEDDSSASFNMTDIFEAKKDASADNFKITKNDDGTLSVEMLVTKDEFASDFKEFAEQLSSIAVNGGTVEVADTLFQLVIDKDNNITSIMAVMNMEIKYFGEIMSVSYDMIFTYNPVDGDYEVALPENLDEYREIK